MWKFSKTKLNIFVSVLHQIVTAVCGMLTARIILSAFGSENHGLMQSIGQILGYAALLEGGIGGVMRAALYKPLANRDPVQLTEIFESGKRFFRRISLIFILFVVVLGAGMKLAITTEFDWLYVFSMVLILGSGSYFGNYSAVAHRILLMADQKLYVIQLFQIFSTGINLLLCLCAVHLGAGIHTVKSLAAATGLMGTVFYCSYVRTHYSFVPIRRTKAYGIPQRRDGVIHYLAYFVHRNTDVVILSLFSSLNNVSIYAVYHMVISVLEQLLGSVSSGIASRIGSLWARKELDRLNETISIYELFNMALTFAIGVVCCILILPFVSFYTAGVAGTDYRQPLFAVLLICGSMASCLKMPYHIAITAAGHYRETRLGALGEVTLNLLISLILIRPLGLIGVAAGTLAAMLFRLFYSVWYLSGAILGRPITKFLKCILPNLVLAAVFLMGHSTIGTMEAANIGVLFLSAIKVSLSVYPAFIALNLHLQPRLFRNLIKFSK